MSELRQVEFFLVRYCGNPVKKESINVGVFAFAEADDEQEIYADTRFAHSWRRLTCFDPDVNIEELQALEREIREDLRDPQRRADFLKRARETHSNVLEIDSVRTCITASPDQALNEISSMYLHTPVPAPRQVSGRERIVRAMRDELEKAGVIDYMTQGIRGSEFTKPGNPLILDFAYSAGGDFKFLHALSLMHQVQAGITLAAEFPQIAAGVHEKRGAKAWLTAVVEDDLPKRDDVDYVLEMMRDNQIAIAPVAEMPRIARDIRLELLNSRS